MRRRVRSTAFLLLSLALGAVAWWRFGPAARSSASGGDPGKRPAISPEPAAGAFEPGPPPRLLTSRPATRERPALAWERLLAADGSPREDVAALDDLIAGYLHAGAGGGSARGRGGIAFNEDLVSALTDAGALGEAALPTDHPAIQGGRLVDRWGTPWQVHPLASDLIQVRSAGPDRGLYTIDDLVSPEKL